MIQLLLVVMLICSLIPAALFFRNLSLYKEPPDRILNGSVSVLIPARNEVVGIKDAVLSVLGNQGVEVEVIVMDDGSTDGTDAVVKELAERDKRVQLRYAPALPVGWNGKQHACWSLARNARFPILCFVDADVRLEPECIARMLHFLGTRSLVSGFPWQETKTFLEWLLLPLIHFVLLGFLPLGRMRTNNNPAFAAGCGQFMMVRAEDYFACGGHSGIKLTMHDGLRLPRLFREHGFSTDLADITSLARCRMYNSAAQVWNGLAKNATEGLGAPARLLPVTLFLLLGQVLPFAFLALGFKHLLLCGAIPHNWIMPSYATHYQVSYALLIMVAIAVAAVWIVRFVAAWRFRQDWRSALLHPLGIILLLAVQWYALGRKVLGRPVSWRSRSYAE